MWDDFKREAQVTAVMTQITMPRVDLPTGRQKHRLKHRSSSALSSGFSR